MEDFEYSLQISELEWDSFFQACEECNMLPPGLAGLDDSGMSDMDDMASHRTRTPTQTASHDPGLRIDSPPDCEGSPVELYLSKYGLSSPDQVLSGSEDDFHLEAVNVFFERLKSVSVTEDHTNLGSKVAGNSDNFFDLIKDTMAVSVEAIQSKTNWMAQENDRTYMQTESTDDNLDLPKSTSPETELFIREEAWSLDVLKAGEKWEVMMNTQADTEKSPCDVLVNKKELTNQVKEAISELATCNNSDLLAAQGQASNFTPRRRRRKKKRISVDLEIDSRYEAQLPCKVSDSDEDTYAKREDIDRETHLADYCGSGIVSKACCALCDFSAHPKQNSISEKFSGFPQPVPAKEDIRMSTLLSPTLQKELVNSAVRVAQSKRETDKKSDKILTAKSAETWQLAIKADLKSFEHSISVTETNQSNTSQSAHTNGDNAGNDLQLNNHLPTEMLPSTASSDMPMIGKKTVSTENLVNVSVSHHPDDVKSQTQSAALKLAPMIQSHTAVYSKTPNSQSEDKVTLSGFQFDGSSAVGQRKTSISCATFPELTDETLFSASYKNTELKENSVNHNETHFNLLAKVDHVNMFQESHQKAQISKGDEFNYVPSDKNKSENTNQKLTDNNVISNISVSLSLKNVPESQEGKNIKAVENSFPDFSGDKNEELSLKGQTNKCKSLIHITEPGSQLSDCSKSEPILSIGDIVEQKGHILPLNMPDHDLLANTVVQNLPSPPPESTGGAKSLEVVDPDSVSQPTPPIYAISSFWNEMEKLTINDILGLRLVGQAQHPSVLLPPTDSSITDVTDAADSGYFMHLDESKPDHTSRNMSFISDFDEDPAEPLFSDASKPDEGTQKSSNPTGIIWDSNPNLSETANEMDEVLISDTAHSSPLHKSNSIHCFRKMCENISVQNLQALESKNLEKIISNASVHSISSVHSMHADVEGDYVDPFDRVETSFPVHLSDEEEIDNNGITFSEIFEYLFGTEEPKESASEADTLGASYSSGTGTSVLEMYEHFFSDFEPESLFYPTADNSSNNNEIIPIFSSSRSANRNVQFPEVYDYFFPDDSPVHSEEEEEPENANMRVVTQNDNTSNKNHNSVKDNSWNFLWSNPFSFRRVSHKGITVQPDESSSQALIPVKDLGSSFREGIQPLNILGAHRGPFLDPLIFNLENRIFRQLADQQKICSEMQTAVADPRLDAPLLPIKQADMCLVCIAFASWVMKSVNPQGADTWKAVLLANVSALSAIRYLRRFTRDEAAKISPLRQIKSV